MRRTLGEAALIIVLAGIAAMGSWFLRPTARVPLRGGAEDLLEWRARTTGIEVLRLPQALEEARRGDRIWLDVRPLREQQRRGRIPWAIPFPTDDPGSSAALPAVEPERPIVLYCESAACDSAFRAAQRLRAAGFRRVAVFVEGFAGWVAAGGEVERVGSERAP